jgi:ornithine--oxo-acid transaminase
MCPKSKEYILQERDVTCYNYAPLPVVLSKGYGSLLTDVSGRVYIDFLSAYSAVNQGHCNPHIIKAAIEQMSILYLSSRAFYNEYLFKAADTITKLFNYDKVLFANGGN